MKNVSQVNEKYFRQAVDEMNKSVLYGIKIQLSDELKEGTLKVFMENVEAVPVEKEAEIIPKIVEMYNFIFDDEYQIPEGIFDEEAVMVEEEQVIMEEMKEEGGEVATEAPVKEKKEKKVKEPKAPKEPKEKQVRNLFENPSAVTRILMLVCENPEITKETVAETLESEGLKITPATIIVQMNDTRKTLTYLTKLGKLA